MIVTFDVEGDVSSHRMCARKLIREVKNGLGLSLRPIVLYVGQNEPGTDNLMSGTFSVEIPGIVDVVALREIVRNHVPCENNEARDRQNYGIDLDELVDFLNATPGTILFVRDLPRISGGGTGTLVYRVGRGFRRVSDDTRVPVEGDV